jgi:hypothetical protein
VKVSKELERKCLALAGGKPKRARAKGRPKLAAGWAVELTLPCVVYSVMNAREHWAVRKRKFDAQRQTLRGVIKESGINSWYPGDYPVRVTFTRVGSGKLDTDNLAASFKALRDELAAWLGVNDGDEASASWHYRQEQGTPGVRVRFENGG